MSTLTPTPVEIRAARLAAGLTQAAAAALVQAGLRSWSHWENGDRRMPAATWELFMIKTRHR